MKKTKTNTEMIYSSEHIELAKKEYQRFLQYRNPDYYNPESCGMQEAQRRCDEHNSIVDAILSGDTELRRKWKLFFLNSVVASLSKEIERKEKQAVNLQSSQDILQPLRDAKKLTAFYKWIDTCGNQFRKQHYSKRYTEESVNAFFAQC